MFTPHQIGRPAWARIIALTVIFAATPVAAQSGDEAIAAGTPPDDGPAYPVSAFVLEYVQEHPGHPPLADVSQTEVALGRLESGFVALRPPLAPVTMRLDEMPDGVETYYASAVQAVILEVLAYFTEREYMGVYVGPHPLDITSTGEDLRPTDRTDLRLVITTGIVAELRTLASGDRIPAPERINNPLHQRIRDRSPLKPFSLAGGDEDRSDLLSRDVLDRYLFFLSRHPGRRVDGAVSASDTPGGVVLDYMITENKPLSFYFQVSNTGTEQTNEWRERFGLFHTQFTNYDDILSLDYVTAGFDESHNFTGSYERPFENDRWRWRVYGNWNEFTADEVGFANRLFTGESWAIGADLIWNFHQDRELFLDLVAGVRYWDVEVQNPFLGTGTQDFLVPHVALRMERGTEWFDTQGVLDLEIQPDAFDADQIDINLLGRFGADKDWVVLRGAIEHSVFLEPLLDRKAWEDPSTPASSTLAHEIYLALRGQTAFGSRLIPQAENTVGGLYTVRGYPESAVAGDDAIIANFEYRFHVPRAAGVQPEPRRLFGQPFRVAPQYVYGQPDWDLVLKAFFDCGFTFVNDPLPFEDDETLLGTGIGAELLFRRNVNIRVDWGFALEDLDTVSVSAGSSQVHFVATIIF